jgi:hypothetical protein
MNFCMDFAGAEAEEIALAHADDLGASPLAAAHLRAGEYWLPCGYRILSTRDIDLPKFQLG